MSSFIDSRTGLFGFEIKIIFVIILTLRAMMTDQNGDRRIIDRALSESHLNDASIKKFRSCLPYATFDNRLKLAQQLKETYPNPRKHTDIFLNFINQNKAQTISRLRSGGIRNLIRGEHRILGVGEDIPFSIIIDDDVRSGGSCQVRKIVIGSDYYALKSLKLHVPDVDFNKEVSILKGCGNVHVSQVFASMKDQAGRCHLILSPWCDVTLITKVI
jgi:hypothetical protein